MATADIHTLTPANQRKAANKMAMNGAFFAFFLALETLMANLMGDLTMWVGIFAGHAAILACVAAMMWPLYLSAQQERKSL